MPENSKQDPSGAASGADLSPSIRQRTELKPLSRRSGAEPDRILVGLDDQLFHQDAMSFAYASQSDARFFDRYWMGLNHPEGKGGFITGMGVYKNTNAIDGFVAFQADNVQHNVRVARPLEDKLEQRVGPLQIRVVEPLRRLAIELEEGAHGLSCAIEWTANTEPFQERQFLSYYKTRTVQNYTRYDQAGRANGWVKVDGTRIDINDWDATRDHSWGVRHGVGGYEPGGDNRHGADPIPYNGPKLAGDSGGGFIYHWLCFSTGEVSGYVSICPAASGENVYMDGIIRYVNSDKVLVLDHGYIEVEFIPGMRVYQKATAIFWTHDGSRWEIVGTPAMTAWVMSGTGYDHGYNDRMGHGYPRHETLEYDKYDITDLRQAYLLPDRTPLPSTHREQPVSISCNGKKGWGHFTVSPRGVLPQYNFPRT